MIQSTAADRANEKCKLTHIKQILGHTAQGAFRVRPTPKIRQEFRSCTPSSRRGADASNLVPNPQARLIPLPAANAKERQSNEDKKVDGLKTYGSVYLLMFIITSTTF